MSDFHLTFSVKKITLVATCIVLGLVALHLVAHFFVYSQALPSSILDIINRVDVGDEISIPTWLSQFLLLACALVLFLIGVVELQSRGRWWRYWIGLGGVLTLASIDEGASLHELLAYLEAPSMLGLSSGYLAFLWVIPGIIISIAL